MGMEGVAERVPRSARVTEPFINLAGVEKTYRMGSPDYPAPPDRPEDRGAGELIAIVGTVGQRQSERS